MTITELYTALSLKEKEISDKVEQINNQIGDLMEKSDNLKENLAYIQNALSELSNICDDIE